MTYVRISEFLHITGLNEHDLRLMLEHGELSVATGDDGELLINAEPLTPEVLAKRAYSEMICQETQEEQALCEEKIASIIVRYIDGIMQDSLALADSWQTKNREK